MRERSPPTGILSPSESDVIELLFHVAALGPVEGAAVMWRGFSIRQSRPLSRNALERAQTLIEPHGGPRLHYCTVSGALPRLAERFPFLVSWDGRGNARGKGHGTGGTFRVALDLATFVELLGAARFEAAAHRHAVLRAIPGSRAGVLTADLSEYFAPGGPGWALYSKRGGRVIQTVIRLRDGAGAAWTAFKHQFFRALAAGDRAAKVALGAGQRVAVAILAGSRSIRAALGLPRSAPDVRAMLGDPSPKKAPVTVPEAPGGGLADDLARTLERARERNATDLDHLTGRRRPTT